jgi:hypothetical protein
MNQNAADGPTRFHFLQPEAPLVVRTFIQETAPEVWEEVSGPGMGGPENCLAAVGTWARYLQGARIPHEHLGRQLTLGKPEAGGYQLPSGEIMDRHFLAVGDELALFDPTARSAHIDHRADTPLDRYRVADGSPFPEWQADRLDRAR